MKKNIVLGRCVRGVVLQAETLCLAPVVETGPGGVGRTVLSMYYPPFWATLTATAVSAVRHDCTLVF